MPDSANRDVPRAGKVKEPELIHDWNTVGQDFDWTALKGVLLDDETLRDGLQNPSVVDPAVEDKIKLVHLMDRLGIQCVNVGLPRAGPRAFEAVEAICREIQSQKLAIRPNCAARTVVADLVPIAEIAQRVGMAIEACVFIGTSPIRQYAEEWTLADILRRSKAAVAFAAEEGLPVTMVTEDTTRTRPDDLAAIYGSAISWGAGRLCISDTVGHATPAGARAVVGFVRDSVVEPSGADVGIDWHGHRDRGFGVVNAIAAMTAGATRIHGTALGIGERCGNTEMDLLLVNLKLLGVHDADLTVLPEYCRLAANACRVPLVHSYPVVGRDAFRTATGVHAAAIVKAEAKGDSRLADRIYSGVPASMVGREQRIDIGPMSGMSNVKHWLRAHGYDAGDDSLAERIFKAAKRTDHTMSAEEIGAVVREPR